MFDVVPGAPALGAVRAQSDVGRSCEPMLRTLMGAGAAAEPGGARITRDPGVAHLGVGGVHATALTVALQKASPTVIAVAGCGNWAM